MMAIIQIKIGDQAWDIRPLTLGQQIEMQRALKSNANAVDKSLAIIKTALSRDHQTAAAGLDEFEGTWPEVDRAAGAILRHGGWLPPLPEPGAAGESLHAAAQAESAA